MTQTQIYQTPTTPTKQKLKIDGSTRWLVGSSRFIDLLVELKCAYTGNRYEFKLI